MHGNKKSNRPFRRFFTYVLFGALFTIVAYATAMADSYSFAGRATRWFLEPPIGSDSRIGPTYDATGRLDLGEPTIRDNAPSQTGYQVIYPITYNFLIGDETYTGTGVMAIRPIGCGALFDCFFQNPLSLTLNNGNTGEQHHWEAFDGAFFHADGSPYPNVFVDTLAYAEPPGRFELYGASFRYGPTFGVGPQLYQFDRGIMIFKRIQQDPVCTAAQAFPAVLWSPNHQFVPIVVMGVTDPDGDAVTITVTGVTQDEPVNEKGDGNTSPDAVIQAGGVSVRAERSGKGNGRVYQVSFKAKDTKGGSCTGKVTVGVPHSMKVGLAAIDDGQIYDSTVKVNPEHKGTENREQTEEERKDADEKSKGVGNLF